MEINNKYISTVICIYIFTKFGTFNQQGSTHNTTLCLQKSKTSMAEMLKEGNNLL